MKIVSAKILEAGPPWLKEDDKRSAIQQKGILYEAKAARFFSALFDTQHNPWIEYVAARRKRAWCQPDLLVWLNDKTLLLGECKLTATKSAKKQLLKLYLPVLKFLYSNIEIRPVQFCQNLKRGDKDNFNLVDLKDVLANKFKWDAATVRLNRFDRRGLDLSIWKSL